MTSVRRACLVVALLLAACGGDDDEPVTHVALDGSPRHADHAGVLEAMADDFSSITVGGRTFAIDPDVQSFSTLTAGATPLRRWRNQFVLVGLDEDEDVVEWLAGVGAVVRLPDAPEVAYLSDVLVGVEEDTAVFRSGTTLRLDDDVAPPAAPPVAVVATIDVASGQVTELAPG